TLAEAYYHVGDLKAALATLEESKARKNGGHRPGACVYRARLYSKFGQPEKGKAEVATAVKLVPRRPEASSYHELAWLLAAHADHQIHDPARAVTLAKKAVELAPQDGNLWNTLGAAHYRAGDWKAAVAALEKSMSLRDGDSSDWFFLAMASWQLGKKEK